MRIRLYLGALVVIAASAFSVEAQDFVWAGGSNASNVAAVFGTQGEASDTATPGGRRRGSAWRTDDGHLWVFGGERVGASPNLGNDLWRYDPATSQWTWVKGVSASGSLGNYGTLGVGTATTVPPARRYSSQMIGTDGKLWLFGGERGASLLLSDLWAYDPETNIWTWRAGVSTTNAQGVYGATNPRPGARNRASTGTDSMGRLIVFGGRGNGSSSGGELNDLWRFDPSDDTWTVLWGTGGVDQLGSYGTVGEPGGFPGGRSGAALWIDGDDRVYVFGGNGFATTITAGVLNDMWRFDPETSQWTWLGGASGINALANYGSLRVSDPVNWPGARRTATTGKDMSGSFVLYGGFGYNSFGSGGLSDLWTYNPASNLWTWIGGPSSTNHVASHGSLGIASPCNRPEAMSDPFSFASNPSRDFHAFGSFYGANGADTIWRFRTPNMEIAATTILPATENPATEVGFSSTRTLSIAVVPTGETPEYLRVSEDGCLLADTILPLDGSGDPVEYVLSEGDGVKSLRLRIGDSEAESYTRSRSITLDTTPPVVTADSLITRETSPGLNGTVFDLHLRDVVVEIGGGNYVPILDEDTWSIQAGTIEPALEPGAYDITVIASDHAGNTTTEVIVGGLVVRPPIESDTWVFGDVADVTEIR